MQKVITINLNGNAYQLDEQGYEALRTYLAHAEAQLAGNPDASESFGTSSSQWRKCQRLLGPGKNVVTAAELTKSFARLARVENSTSASQMPPLGYSRRPSDCISPRGCAISGCVQRHRRVSQRDPTIRARMFVGAGVLEPSHYDRPPLLRSGCTCC